MKMIVAKILRPFEDNHGRVNPGEASLTVRNLRKGDVLQPDQIATWSQKYRDHLAAKGYATFEELTHCPTCGHALS